jgi:hypothetical protein
MKIGDGGTKLVSVRVRKVLGSDGFEVAGTSQHANVRAVPRGVIFLSVVFGVSPLIIELRWRVRDIVGVFVGFVVGIEKLNYLRGLARLTRFGGSIGAFFFVGGFCGVLVGEFDRRS